MEEISLTVTENVLSPDRNVIQATKCIQEQLPLGFENRSRVHCTVYDTRVCCRLVDTENADFALIFYRVLVHLG